MKWIYIPDYRIGIEYDGIFYHSSLEAKERELRKNEYLRKSDIVLIRVKETEKDIQDQDNIIYRNLKRKDLELENIIYKIFDKISKVNGKKYEPDIDINRDKQEIWAKYIFLSKSNSLLVKYPDLAREWSYEKNNMILPEQVSVGSHKRVWWKCKQGHEWEAVISKRTLGRGCPYCSNRRILKGYNDLQTKFPLVAERWDSKKNGIEANQVFPFSNKKAWWKCSW